MSLPADIATRFASLAPPCDAWSVRVMHGKNESLAVTRGVPDPVHLSDDLGVMVTVQSGTGLGYAATSDISVNGLARAGRAALEWAARAGGRMVSPVPHR
ncbi:MAG: hypothetical protein K2P94_01455, partial [Rhodospirillaceae bacterium]|nr:hypothetical protein [Rhodospirillaceae bacterium]